MIEEAILKNEEKAVFKLRSLYKKYGYMPFKMSKFEEYDLYVRNKDFLISDRVITFNDTNGKLLALKPDVTLSIIKNGEDEVGVKQKVYYNENVYRVSGGTHQYKEIMQAGLECIGDIDIYDIYEVVLLAASSLSLISEQFVLDISHLGILSALLDDISTDKSFRKELSGYIAEKNMHDSVRLCNEYGVSEEKTQVLCRLVGIRGDMESAIDELCDICQSESAKFALDELKALKKMLERTEFYDKIRFDFSIVNDMNYYNGIVFKGFLSGICESVLSGGQYDKLMRRMGRGAGAIGFALYLDLLEALQGAPLPYDVDILIIYDEKSDAMAISELSDATVKAGKSVSVQKAIPKKLRYREMIDMRGGKV
ncbi:MAG: ATP phosphoribosyltransferase regulatory subunit [Clostridia bacterium]|nr:ATP phosphoribosyltransferase regulatory subunit [Clostridia bacterium]